MSKSLWFGVLTMLGYLLSGNPASGQTKAAIGKDRGLELVGIPTANHYAKQWALLVGINYSPSDRGPSERPKAWLAELNNAEKDARDLQKILLDHYGYQKENIKVLLGKEATHEAIGKHLDAFFIGNAERIGPEDSVLVFFAGHGGRSEDEEDRGFFYPFDAEFEGAKPLEYKLIRFHQHLVKNLNKSPARHKLLILDCCHSGEIFNKALPYSPSDDRFNQDHFKAKALQVVASCRATQPAADGLLEENSPFLQAFRRALTTLPVRYPGKELPVSRLFLAMTPEFQYLPRNQSPSLRNLVEDGEFYFFPDPNSIFSVNPNTDADVKVLRAMTPGEHGNWWFEETPWLIPSLRQAIVGELPAHRTTSLHELIGPKVLKKCAEDALKKLKENAKDLTPLRLKQMEQLLNPPRGKEYKELLEAMVKDLVDMEKDLKPPDWHFLAVLQHALNDKAASNAYHVAIKGYEADRKKGQATVLEALALADLGHFELEVRWDAEAAIVHFNEAFKIIEQEQKAFIKSPQALSPFCIFLGCRKAEAWQRLNIWSEANDGLDSALELARDLDPRHPLAAFVHRRRAWAFMEQWRFSDAENEFLHSNDILKDRTELESEIAVLHNKHGLAMAKRFKGKTGEALREYGDLVQDIVKTLGVHTNKPSQDFSAHEVRALLFERFVNTHERLADCNLFSPPDERDIGEAVDDLRRAYRLCSSLKPSRRGVMKAGILYKQGMALSLASPVQDVELAEAFCREAIKLDEEAGSPSALEFWRKLVPPIVDLHHSSGPEADSESKATKSKALRQAITDLKELLTQNTNRDQLEFLMFATKILIEEGSDQDRFLQLQNAEDLLSFCRRVLLRPARGGRTHHYETAAYLRPYFETVLKVRLRHQPKQVKGLIEVAWEATMGKPYRRTKEPRAALALFTLEAKPYLFLDVPRQGGQVFPLEGEVTLDELRTAITADKGMPLPRGVKLTLDKLAKAEGNQEVHIYWYDPVQKLGEYPWVRIATAKAGLRYRCPFEFPSYLKSLEPTLPGQSPGTTVVGGPAAGK